MPDALGEELLIIQKEFDGFADTRERLDLLALDKNGQLVIIENKLDDTGRDVVWQAVKYAAYCSNLTKTQIIDIFQQYLDRWSRDKDAETAICEFLDEDSLEEVVLNGGNDQRLMFIAANFRKEVTAAVLWLLGHGVRAQCFRVVPHVLGEQLFIDLPTDYSDSGSRRLHDRHGHQGCRGKVRRRRAATQPQATLGFLGAGTSGVSPSRTLAVRQHKPFEG